MSTEGDNEKKENAKISPLEPLWFFLACLAIALLFFCLRFIDIYYEGVIKQTYTSTLGWVWAAAQAVFLGSLAIGGLLLAFPQAVLKRSILVRRAKKLLGL